MTRMDWIRPPSGSRRCAFLGAALTFLGTSLLAPSASWAEDPEPILEAETEAGDRIVVFEAIRGDDGRFVLLTGTGDEIPLQALAADAEVTVLLDHVPEDAARDEHGHLRLFHSGTGIAHAFPDGVKVTPDGGRWVIFDENLAEVFPGPDESFRVTVESPPDETDDGDFLSDLKEVATNLNLNDKEKLAKLSDPGSLAKEVMSDLLQSPETLNIVLDELLDQGKDWQLLRDLDLRFKVFEQEGGSAALGMAYAYEKSQGWKYWESGSGLSGMSYQVRARGNVAFESEVNPADFLDFGLNMQYFQSRGGVGSQTESFQERAVEVANAATRYETDEGFLASPEWTEISAMALSALSTQVYWDFGLNGAIEANQRFTQKQYVYGLRAALDVKAWNQDSRLAHWNLFDYPGALLRLLSGYDRRFQPRGSTYPTLLVGIDRIDPKGDTPRALAGDTSAYDRVRLEVAMKTPLARYQGKEYFLVVNWRYYGEISASEQVKSAGLNSYDFIAIGLEGNEGFFVTWADGRQPFDVVETSFFSLGWKTSF